MAKKVIAYYKSENGFVATNIYQAIKMKNRQIKNRDEELVFYDTPNEKIAEPMFTRRTSKDGKNAHFCYYPGSKHSGVMTETSMTHKIYEIAFSSTKEIKLYAFGDEITLYVEEAYPECFIKTEYNSYYIDVLLKLKGTEPKSLFYKWGGQIAIEILVSHKVDKSKINDLTRIGIQVFELKVYPNQYIPEDIVDEQMFSHYIDLVKKRIMHSKNVGQFINDVNPDEGSLQELRYLQLRKFEETIQGLQKEIETNEKRLKDQQSEIEKYSKQLCDLINQGEKLKQEIVENKNQLYIIENTIAACNELIQKNETLRSEIKNLQNDLVIEKQKVENLQASLKAEREKGFLQKLFRCR